MTPPYTVSVAEEAGVPSPPSLAEEVAGAQKEEREASAVSVRNLARPLPRNPAAVEPAMAPPVAVRRLQVR